MDNSIETKDSMSSKMKSYRHLDRLKHWNTHIALWILSLLAKSPTSSNDTKYGNLMFRSGNEKIPVSKGKFRFASEITLVTAQLTDNQLRHAFEMRRG